MKLEVGMYCRYKNFQNKIKIAKIKGIQKADEVFQYDYMTFDNDDGELETNIIKASFDVIDLIKVGDVLKFKELRTHITNPSNTKYYEDYIYDVHNEEELEIIKQELKKKHIKLLEVVTKEQFEQMSYKVGE